MGGCQGGQAHSKKQKANKCTYGCPCLGARTRLVVRTMPVMTEPYVLPMYGNGVGYMVVLQEHACMQSAVFRAQAHCGMLT